MNNPTATLYGFDENGTDHSIVVTLSSAMSDSNAKVRITGACIECSNLARSSPAAHCRNVDTVLSYHHISQ